jgi:hypothetical protein
VPAPESESITFVVESDRWDNYHISVAQFMALALGDGKSLSGLPPSLWLYKLEGFTHSAASEENALRERLGRFSDERGVGLPIIGSIECNLAAVNEAAMRHHTHLCSSIR